MSRKKPPKRFENIKKKPGDCANNQPDLFEHSVVVAHRDRHSIVSHRAKKRKQKRNRRRRMKNNVINLRAYKAQTIVNNSVSRIQWNADHYLVPSENGDHFYKVDTQTHACECPDYLWRHEKCKHVMAIEIAFGQVRKPDTWQPKSYDRNWRAYNESQINEKTVFLNLLSTLTRSIDGPEQSNGRPALSLGDMVFACVFKVYSQLSSRRFSTDLKDAELKGFINEAAHYSSLNRYMEKTSITPFLEALVEQSSAPLASLEENFAIDSTGLGISNSVAWSRAKYHDQKMLKVKNWVKLHCCVGVKTGIITGVEITDKMGHDSSQFVSVLDQTRKNFTVKEVSADMAYSSRQNLFYATSNQIAPFIPFRENTAHSERGTWGRLYHFFQFNRVEFLKSYNKRNNVEAAFGALKAKFGSTLKSRNREAQKNEALCKVIAYNVVCLIHAMNEFGIRPDFIETLYKGH